MPNLFPYTNTHELNLDWILQVVKDFQTKYTTFDQALADALEAIESGKVEALDEISTDLTAALNDIEASQTAALTAIGNTKDQALVDIGAALTNATNAISALNTTVQGEITTLRNTSISEITTAQGTAISAITASMNHATTIIEQLYNTLPASAQDVLGRLDLLDNIITGNTMESFTWLQGSYIYPEGVTPPTPPAIYTESPTYNQLVSSRYMTGVGGRRIRITTDGTIYMTSILTWRNTPPGGGAGGYVPGQASWFTNTYADILLPLDVTAFSIEISKPNPADTIAPTDIPGHIEIQWITDFVSQRIIAPKESSTTADVARAVGEYFFLDGDLYIATDDIVVGDTIAEHTNCEKKTVGGELSELKSAIKYVAENTGLYEVVVPYTQQSGYQYLPFTIAAGTYLFSNVADGQGTAAAAELLKEDNTRVIAVSAGSVNLEITVTAEQALLIKKIVTRATTFSYKPKTDIVKDVERLKKHELIANGVETVTTQDSKSIVVNASIPKDTMFSVEVKYNGLHTNRILIRYTADGSTYIDLTTVYGKCTGNYVFVAPANITKLNFYIYVDSSVENATFSYGVYYGNAITNHLYEEEDAVLLRNEDVLPYVFGGCHYGINANGNRNVGKYYGLLIMTDVHGSVKQTANAIKYLTQTGAISALANLGDITSQYFNDTDGTWYTGLVNSGEKPVYTILGNHDVTGQTLSTDDAPTLQAAVNKWIKPTEDKMYNASTPGNPYYSVTDDANHIVFIYWNDYGIVNDTVVDGSYVYKRDLVCCSQAQLNWLVSTLENIPSGYHLVFAKHSIEADVTFIDTVWTDENPAAGRVGSAYSNEMIPEIINAWINGSTLSKSYQPGSRYETFDTLTVNCDFTSRGTGIFACYLCGHAHRDYVARLDNYQNQLAIGFAASAYDNYSNYGSDLPRVINTKTEDVMSVFSIDTTNKVIRLMRVGSNITVSLRNRTFDKLSYAAT